MASAAGLKAVVSGDRWNFPRFDDQSSSVIHSEQQPRPATRTKTQIAVSAVIGVAVLGLGASATGIVLNSLGSSQVLTPDTKTFDAAISEVGEARELVLHVSGAVNSPGLVELQEGARVHDAIRAAGGVTTGANVGALNLARLVVDGEHLVVPAEGEVPDSVASSSDLVSLSLASASELERLSGVGPALAQRIITWREEHGPFRQVEDILAVSGIGPATLEGFRNQVVP